VQLGATSVDVTEGPVDVPVRVQVSDTGGPGPASGVASVTVDVGTKAIPNIGGDLLTVHLSPSADPGWWTGVMSVPQWRVTKPTWFVLGVRVTDHAGQSLLVGQQALSAAGQSASLDITHRADLVAPVLADLAVRPQTVDVSAGTQAVRVVARVTDAGGSGTATVNVAGVLLHRVSGTSMDGVWRGRLVFHRWMPGDGWILDVALWDGAGNGRGVWYERLRARGLPWQVRIVGSVPDDAKPQLRHAQLADTEVDVRDDDALVAVRARLTDDAAGVAWARAVLRDSSGAWRHSVALHLVRGSRRDGVWRGRLLLPRCASVTGKYTLEIRGADRLGQGTVRRTSLGLTIHANDHQAPTWTIADSLDAGDSELAVRFNEPVAGLTTGTLALSRSSGAGTGAVSGQWYCSDSAATVVNCDAGPVTTAVFRTASPAAAGTSYALVSNPEHVLSLTDLAGNPCSDSNSWTTAA
jgi:hypothetical protein